MQEIINKIMEELSADKQIDTSGIEMQVKTRLLQRRKSIVISGYVKSEEAKTKVTEVAELQARDDYDVVNELTVSA